MFEQRPDGLRGFDRRFLAAVLLAAAGTAAADRACEGSQGMSFVCGPLNAEDLVAVPDTSWVLASGMSGDGISGHLYLLDPESRGYEVLYPSPSARHRWNREAFGGCPAELDPADFSAHGLSILDLGDGRSRLYMTSHGAREAVEIFEVDSRGEKPSVAWVGCVPMREHDSINSVAALSDGGFITTRIMEEGPGGDEPVFAGEISGFLYEWHPGGTLERLAGTEMSGPNGIVVSPDGNWVFVGSWGRGEVERFARDEAGALQRAGTLGVGFRVDNLRWTDEGTILAVGHRLAQNEECDAPLCFDAWEVAEVDPHAMTATTLLTRAPIPGFTGATVALRDRDGGLWLGTFHGDRLAYIAQQDR